MTKTRIEWADAVWNPVTGCTPISPGCAHCYARTMAKRLAGRCGYPEYDPFCVTLHPERLEEPLRWKRPRRIFVGSMTDIFHNEVTDEFLDRIFAVIALCPQHIFLILTKRPGRMWLYLSSAVRWPLPNVWLGVTAEGQHEAIERIPVLLRIPAAVRFVSVEPMLEPVDLFSVPINYGNGFFGDPFRPHHIPRSARDRAYNTLDWVICGCETGPQARPMEVDWVRDLRDQCQEAGVPFFLKAMRVDGRVVKLPELDGRKWDQMPMRPQER